MTSNQREAAKVIVCDLSMPGELAFEVNRGEDVVIETALDGVTNIENGSLDSRYGRSEVFVGVHSDAALHSEAYGETPGATLRRQN